MPDRLGRPLRDLRISVTDRCNLRCPYCMPREVYGAGFRFLPREELLSFEEITGLVAALSREGVSRLRLTGGEPLLRRGLERLVEMLAGVEGIAEIALTTNGTLLAGRARDLRDAGLGRVTVSLDALAPDVARRMSDARLSPARVLAGIDAAVAAGLTPVKVNMVVRRGINDRCVLDMAEHFRGHPATLRFIEYMDVGSTNGWREQDVVSGAEVRAVIAGRWPLEPVAPTRASEVARRYRYCDGAGEIGFIESVSNPFCGGCTRARLSADGQLYTCLFSTRGHDLRAALRSGADEEELRRRVRGIWSRRSDRYSEERAGAPAGRPRPAKVEMSYIGG
jgi:cyclic pyranopterin phosphate synthase